MTHKGFPSVLIWVFPKAVSEDLGAGSLFGIKYLEATVGGGGSEAGEGSPSLESSSELVNAVGKWSSTPWVILQETVLHLRTAPLKDRRQGSSFNSSRPLSMEGYSRLLSSLLFRLPFRKVP